MVSYSSVGMLEGLGFHCSVTVNSEGAGGNMYGGLVGLAREEGVEIG